jgi:predicted NAD/FAD-binding protein
LARGGGMAMAGIAVMGAGVLGLSAAFVLARAARG